MVRISIDTLIMPYFVTFGKDKKEAIKSFPGQYRFSIDRLLRDIESLRKPGIDKILLFGVPGRKDAYGSAACEKGNIVSAAVKEIKKEYPDIIVMTDVCLCAYTDHGHCGIIEAKSVKRKTQNFINNNATLKILAQIALSHAEGGTDWVAPSAMAKGQVLAIRRALDQNGFKTTKIMGYSAKFASNFYAPFREAAACAPKFADRSGYQLDYGDADRALKEIQDDIKEGADMVMVKPALSYLDIIKEAKIKFSYPLAAYNVSGEYAMVKAYCDRLKAQGSRLNEERQIVLEILTSIKRAGADLIITYHAKDAARWSTGK